MHRLPQIALATALLASCQTEPPTCDDVAEPSPIAACVAPSGGWDADQPTTETPLRRLFPGTVTEVSTTAPADACYVDGAHVGAATPPAAGTVWLRVTDGADEEWVVGMSADGLTTDSVPGVGLPVVVDYSYLASDSGPDVGHLSLIAADDSLLLWIGQGTGVEEIDTPEELSIAQGPEVCSEFDDCRAWSKYNVAVAVNGQPADDGQPVNHGSSAELEGFRFLHGGYEEQTSTSGECVDAYRGYLRAALISLP